MDPMTFRVRLAILLLVVSALPLAAPVAIAEPGCAPDDPSCSSPPPCQTDCGSGNSTAPPPSGGSGGSGSGGSGGHGLPGVQLAIRPSGTDTVCRPVDGTGGKPGVKVYPILNMVVINDCVFEPLRHISDGPVGVSLSVGDRTFQVKIP